MLTLGVWLGDGLLISAAVVLYLCGQRWVDAQLAKVRPLLNPTIPIERVVRPNALLPASVVSTTTTPSVVHTAIPQNGMVTVRLMNENEVETVAEYPIPAAKRQPLIRHGTYDYQMARQLPNGIWVYRRNFT